MSSTSSSSCSSSSSSSPPQETHEMEYIVIPITGGHGSSTSTSARVVAIQTPSAAAHAHALHLKQASIDEQLLRINEAIVRNQHWILFGQIGIMILIIVATLLVAQQLEGLRCKP